MTKNQGLAVELNRPSCQDTGVLQFWLKCGTNFPYINELEGLLKEAVVQATFAAPLRHNSVETFDEYNTKKNVGKGTPTVWWDIVPNSDKCEIYAYMAGGGCTLPGKAMVLMPGAGYEGVTDFVLDQMTSYGLNACPPLLVGVGVGYTLAANEYYREDVPYDKINLLFMGDNSAKTMALQSGQVDLVENITNVADIQDFQDSDDFTVDIASGVRCGFAWMNFDGVLGNKTLRQAILMAIDYDTICNSRTIGGLYTPGFSVLPSTLNYDYDKLENPYTYDPEKAKQILDDAGIVDTDGDGIRELDGQNINLRYISYENRLLNDFADAHAQYLAEIGIGVVPEYGSSDDQWSKLAALDYDFNNNNWITVGTGDPLAYMANWATDTSYCAYSNPDYDKLYEELKGEMDPEKRKDLIFQMQQILVDDAAVLIDGYYNSSMIYSKKVGSAHIHTADYYWLSTEITPAE